MQKKYLFADKVSDNIYSASDLVDDREKCLWNLEYGDVANGQFQLWEYPSGKIYDVVPDRSALAADDYSGPDSEIWLPKLKYLKTDKRMVSEEYARYHQQLTKRQGTYSKLVTWFRKLKNSK